MKFELDLLEREVGLIAEIAKPYLEPESHHELVRARYALRDLPPDVTTACWSIDKPLRTTRSPGSYTQDGEGEHTVRANIKTLWELTRVDNETVVVRDNVSTAVSITTESEEIACWTMDIAAISSAPGCGLHTQVKPREGDSGAGSWFPVGLDVPRVPVFIPTIGAVIEYVLGELFQHEWTAHVGAHQSASNWRDIQRRSWDRWLDWQKEIVRRSTISPWLEVKAHRCDLLDDH